MSYQIHVGDCMEFMRGLPDASVDCIITDPPYSERTHQFAATSAAGVKMRTRCGEKPPTEIAFSHASTDFLRRMFSEASRVSRRWVVSFLDFRHALAFDQEPPAGLRFVRLGVWVKPNGMPQLTGDRPGMGWEAVAIMHKKGAKMRWNGGGRCAVFRHNTPRNEGGEHPTAKPESLMLELVQLFTNPGETILDPFAGSGTTGVAAILLGRNALLCEMDPKHAATAKRRCEDALQDRLFFGG